jgi:hypothetical protein
MNATDRPSGFRFAPRIPGGRLAPVLARALETGRGPGGVTRWLASRQATPATVAGLADELDRTVRRAGVAETLRE